jgi:CDP-6-deoxy-D-xylo-4-hexulose-3-dehydrase
VDARRAAPGYDHKYIYSHVGYNLKTTDLQGALLMAQMKKLPGFIEARKANWKFYREALAKWDEWLLLPEPTPAAIPRGSGS